MKIIVLASYLIVTVACKKKEPSLSILEAEITNVLVDLNLNDRVLIKNITKVTAKDSVAIEIAFSKPYIAHPVQQEVLFSYILYHLSSKNEWRAIDFLYYLDKEKFSNAKIISYNASKILKVNTSYASPMLLEMVAFCMKKFSVTDPYVLDKSIQYVNEVVPDKTIAKDFFELLSLFNDECNQPSIDHLAANTLILIYQLRKEFSEQTEYKNVINLLAELWTFCCLDGIESASKQYFSAPELLFPCS